MSRLIDQAVDSDRSSDHSDQADETK
jgi:hypothetical protein